MLIILKLLEYNLTWINSNSRDKTYNKFLCQLTAGGLYDQLGNNIYIYIYCQDKRLKTNNFA